MFMSWGDDDKDSQTLVTDSNGNSIHLTHEELKTLQDLLNERDRL